MHAYITGIVFNFHTITEHTVPSNDNTLVNISDDDSLNSQLTIYSANINFISMYIIYQNNYSSDQLQKSIFEAT